MCLALHSAFFPINSRRCSSLLSFDSLHLVPFPHSFDTSINLSIMKFFSLLCGLALLASSALCLTVTGVPGSTHTRYEIRQLASKYPKQWSLFLLAMQQFQNQSQSLQTSYYQIAGIHGVPRVNFDGVAQCSSCGGTDGYCTHSSILFLGWHRTYLAL